MTVEIENIIPPKDAETVDTAQYTSDDARTIIDKFTATNVSAGILTLSVNIVPKSGSVSNTNLIIDAKSIAVDETFTFPPLVGHIMRPGDFISTNASATGLTIRASGRVVT